MAPPINPPAGPAHSEQEIRDIFLTAPVGIAVMRKHVFSQINKQFLALTGYNQDEVIGKDARFLFTDDISYESAAHELHKIAPDGKPAAVDAVIRRKDGRLLDVILKSSQTEPSATSSLQVISVLDFSERKQTGENRDATEKRFQHLLANTNDLFSVIDAQGIFLSLHGPVQNLLGYTADELVGKCGLDFIHPDDLIPATRNLEQVVPVPGSTRRIEYRTRRKDGQWIHVETVGTNWLHDPSIRGIVLNIRDVSERKKTEEALRLSEARLEAAQKNAKIGSWEYNPNTGQRHWSKELYHLYGIAPRSQPPTHEESLNWIHPDDRGSIDAAIQHIVKNLTTSTYEYRSNPALGPERNFLATFNVVKAPTGKLQLIAGTTQDITERRRAEESVRLSEARLEAAQAHAQTGSWDLDLSIGVGYWSKQLFRLFDLEPAATPPAFGEFLDLVHSADRATVANVFDKAAQTGDSARLIYRTNPARCTPRFLEANILPTQAGAQKTFKLEGTIQDVTERKLNEESLRESETRLREIFDNTSDAIFSARVENDGRFVYENINLAVTRIGLSPSAFRTGTKTPHDIFPPESAKKITTIYQQYVATRKLTEAEQILSTPVGVRIFATKLVPLFDETGSVVRVVGFAQDITERKAAAQALRESETKYRDIFENAIEGIFQTNLDGTLRNANRALAQLHGYDTPEEMMAAVTDVRTQTYVNPQDRDYVIEQLRAQGRISNFEVQVKHRDGHAIWVLMHMHAVKDASDNILYFEGSNVDITEHKRLAELQAAQAQAEIASRAKSVFLANMSHEIRTPMNAILGFTQLMLRDETIKQEQRDHLETIDRNGEYLLNLLNDVLEISKIEAQRATLKLGPCDLRGLARDLHSMFHARIETKGIALTVDGISTLPGHVIADEGKIRQILINLLSNAAKFTSHGRIALRLRALRHDEAHWIIQAEVEDTGMGIAPDEMERLFQQFEQTAAGRKTGSGAGLGLAISREFSRMMNGDITVRSVEGQGSTFSLTIKVGAVASEEPFEKKPTAHHILRLKASQPPCKILVVDDQADNRRLLTELLAKVGFEVFSATNGAEAITAFLNHLPHAIVMDLRMPTMDGAEATRRIRALPGGGAVKILGLSASVIQELRDPMVGVDDFMGKPFRDDDLLERLQQLLNIAYDYADNPHSSAIKTKAVQIPGAFVEPLRKAFIAADLDAVLALLTEMSKSAPEEAAEFRAMANRFDWDGLTALLPNNQLLP